jgi:ABC-type transporter Mla subunit MlaD
LGLWIESQAKVREDSEAAISTLGLMGEKYVEIRSGKSREFLKSGGVVASREPVDLSRLMEKVGGVADEAKLALEDFRKTNQYLTAILTDAQPKLSRILTNVDGILEVNRPKLDGILGNLDGILETNRPKIDHILTNLEDTSEYFKEFSEDIKYHPWKVLAKGKEKSSQEIELLREARISKKAAEASSGSLKAGGDLPQATAAQTPKKNKGFLLFGK